MNNVGATTARRIVILLSIVSMRSTHSLLSIPPTRRNRMILRWHNLEHCVSERLQLRKIFEYNPTSLVLHIYLFRNLFLVRCDDTNPTFTTSTDNVHHSLEVMVKKYFEPNFIIELSGLTHTNNTNITRRINEKNKFAVLSIS